MSEAHQVVRGSRATAEAGGGACKREEILVLNIGVLLIVSWLVSVAGLALLR